MTDDQTWASLLNSILVEFDCQTGTIHRSDDGRNLNLIVQAGVPAGLLEKISFIPFGKGIAGAAAESGQPVELCNLQQDLGGVAKPDARQTGVAGSIAVPVFSAANGAVTGTLGIGKHTPYEFTSEEKLKLARHTVRIAALFEHKAG